ncbi:MAG TPA: hypothetical protein DD640_03695, partial [Clostridiales bacterium]|nr:hypothetical protein [Clostridiales bacterium]
MEKVKVGVFGAFRGMHLIRALIGQRDVDITAVCDRNEALLAQSKDVLDSSGHKAAFYRDFESFFQHGMDAVILANYAIEHAPYAIRFLESGRHVLSEVLPVETMGQAVELVEAVERSGRVYGYAENYCYFPVAVR